MNRANILKRLGEAEEAVAIKPAIHFVWDDGGTGAQDRIDQMIATGRAKATDTFHTMSWLTPEAIGARACPGA